jgi:hypothetical protein
VEHRGAESNDLREEVLRALVRIGGPFLLVLTCVLLHGYLTLVTEGWLAPWGQLPDGLRPPAGTWQRTINDLFDGPPWATLPAWFVLVTSLILFARRILRSQERGLLPLEFATLNVLFVLVDLALVVPAHLLVALFLEQPRPEGDAGYHHTWLAVVVTVGLLCVLFRAQANGWLAGRKRMGAPKQLLLVGAFLLLLLLMRL